MVEVKSDEEERTERRTNKRDFFQNRVQDLGGIGLSFLGMGGMEEKAGFINKGLRKGTGKLFDKFSKKPPIEKDLYKQDTGDSGTTEFQDKNQAQKVEKDRETKEDNFHTKELHLLSTLKNQGEDQETQEEDKEKQLALENEKITKKAESKQNKKDFFKNRAQDAVGIGLSFLGLGGLEEKASVIGKGVDKASEAIFTKIFGPIPEALEENGEKVSDALNDVDETVESLDEPTKKTESEQYQEVVEKQRVHKETERDIREGKFERDQLGVLNTLEDYQVKTLKWQDELLDKQDELILGQRRIVRALDGDGPLDDLFDRKKKGKPSKSRSKGGKKGFFKGIASKAGGLAAGAGSFLTGGLGLSGMLGSSMGGIAGAGAGAMAGSAALVLGAGAAGYGAGTLLNKGVSALTGSESWGTDWMMDAPLPDPELKGKDFKNPDKLQSAIKTLQEQVKEKESEFWTSAEDEIAIKSKKQQITMYQTLLTKTSEKEDIKKKVDDIKEPKISEEVKEAQEQVASTEQLVNKEKAILKEYQESEKDDATIEAKEFDVEIAEGELKTAQNRLKSLEDVSKPKATEQMADADSKKDPKMVEKIQEQEKKVAEAKQKLDTLKEQDDKGFRTKRKRTEARKRYSKEKGILQRMKIASGERIFVADPDDTDAEVEAKRAVFDESKDVTKATESIIESDSDVKLQQAEIQKMEAKEKLAQSVSPKERVPVITEGATLMPDVTRVTTSIPTIAPEELRAIRSETEGQRIPIVTPPAREAPQRIPMPLPSERGMDRSTSIDDLGLIYLNSVLLG